MDTGTNYRALIMTALGVFSLLATLASSSPRNGQNTQSATDVSLSMLADRNTVKAGQNVTYTATMTNLGPADATFVDVAFAIPDGLQILSIGCDQGISPDGPFCEYSSLPVGAAVVSTLVATPRSGATVQSRLLKVSASALFENADAFDPNPNNNTASVKTKLIGRLPQP